MFIFELHFCIWVILFRAEVALVNSICCSVLQEFKALREDIQSWPLCSILRLHLSLLIYILSDSNKFSLLQFFFLYKVATNKHVDYLVLAT